MHKMIIAAFAVTSALASAAVLVSPASAAMVTGQISLAGYAAAIGSTSMGSVTGINFVQDPSGSASPGVAGGLTSFGGGSGSFAGLSCASSGGNCGSIQDLLTFDSGAVSRFLTLDTGIATSITFDLANISMVTRDSAANSINIRASGTINYTGFESTAGTFFLTAQGSDVTSYSATLLANGATPAVPEPATWALMIVGFGAIGAAIRCRSVAISFAQEHIAHLG